MFEYIFVSHAGTWSFRVWLPLVRFSGAVIRYFALSIPTSLLSILYIMVSLCCFLLFCSAVCQVIYCLDELRFSRSFCSKSMLSIVENVVFLEVFHSVRMNNVFEDLIQDACQRSQSSLVRHRSRRLPSSLGVRVRVRVRVRVSKARS